MGLDAVKRTYNEYMREWRRKNKDKVKQYRNNYWLKRAEQEQDTNENKVSEVMEE